MLFSTHPDPVSASPFHIMGYSLGGRVALSLYQSQPAKFDKMVLLAPDGLKVNTWYWMATQTKMGKKLFAFTMRHPGWFFTLLKVLNKLGLVNSSVFKFVNYYIGNPGARHLLYQRWIGMRKLRPNLNRIKSFISNHQTVVRIVYGKHDRIILEVVGDKFCKGIEENCKIINIESGHQVLHQKHSADILSALRH
jgi:pimeloyl-ACP methyl ester carboxylesterase